MRFDINLASNPYQDARSFYLRAGTALTLVFLLTVFLIGLTLHQRSNTRALNARIDEARRSLAALQKERDDSLAILNRPENRGTRDHSHFVNGLIVQKAFSWTQVFSDLESVMPDQVHVVSINPELNKQNQIAMHMIVAGNSREKALDLVEKLETSPHFRAAKLVAEQKENNAQNPQDTIAFEITALYYPEGQAPAPAAPAGKGGM